MNTGKKLEIKNGRFGYPRSGRTVLNDISFSLDRGDVLAVLGPNGAGKTTLLRCMTGLLKWDAGMTVMDGRRLDTVPRRERWQKISYVPQAKHAPAAYTVEEMVLLGRAAVISPFSLPGRADREAADRCIEKTGLGPLRHRLCTQLSGGEYQMVLIARALVTMPEILILDEPESNLDFQNQLLILNRISELSTEGIACVFNTHYPAHALRWANKSLMLSKNGTYCFGAVHQVITQDNILRFFGVRSVIGELKTADGVYADVVPIGIGPPEPDGE